MRRPTQGCLFESDRPRWHELETTSRERLRQLMERMLLEAARRIEVAKGDSKSEREVSDDEFQAHV